MRAAREGNDLGADVATVAYGAIVIACRESEDVVPVSLHPSYERQVRLGVLPDDATRCELCGGRFRRLMHPPPQCECHDVVVVEDDVADGSVTQVGVTNSGQWSGDYTTFSWSRGVIAEWCTRIANR